MYKEGERWVYMAKHGSNRYLIPSNLFYVHYNTVPYFESKYHSVPLGTLFPVEVINYNYNYLWRLV